jgi:hypothetical protein
MRPEINKNNEAVIFDSLKEFYLSEIRNAGSLYSTSKKLGKSHNYIHEIVSKPKSIETLREVYFLIYPERKKFDKKKSS